MRSQAPYNSHEVILCRFRSSPCVSIWRGIISPIIILQIKVSTRKLCTASGMIDPSPLRRLEGSVHCWAASLASSSVMMQSGRNNGQKSEALVPSNKKTPSWGKTGEAPPAAGNASRKEVSIVGRCRAVTSPSRLRRATSPLGEALVCAE